MADVAVAGLPGMQMLEEPAHKATAGRVVAAVGAMLVVVARVVVVVGRGVVAAGPAAAATGIVAVDDWVPVVVMLVAELDKVTAAWDAGPADTAV